MGKLIHLGRLKQHMPNAEGSRRLSRVLPYLLVLAFIPPAFAQPATKPNPKAAIAAPAAGKAVKAAGKETESINTIPSRQVTNTELPSYLESHSSAFLIRSRARDPFGQSQDPDAKPVVKASVVKTSHHAAPILATPFAEIIRLIVVTTIMPKEKRFLVGTRSIQQGEQIPLNYRGKHLRVLVTEVTSGQIGFRNLDTGETAARKLSLLPPGMTMGNHGMSAPGMVQDRQNASIELETGSTKP